MGSTAKKGPAIKLEKAVLVGVATREVTLKQAREHLAELERLADTAGAVVVEQVLQRRPSFDTSTLIGEGKAREVAPASSRPSRSSRGWPSISSGAAPWAS
jgi:GTP-binding protein HflX